MREVDRVVLLQQVEILFVGFTASEIKNIRSCLSVSAIELGIAVNTKLVDSFDLHLYLDNSSPWHLAFVAQSAASQFAQVQQPWVLVQKDVNVIPKVAGTWNYSIKQCENSKIVSKLLAHISTDISFQQDLAQEKRQFISMANSLKDGVRLADKEGVIFFVNSAMEEIGGYTASEMIGRKSGELFFSDDAEMLVIMTQRTKERLEGKTELYEIQIQRKDGVKRWVEVKAAPLRNSSGDITGSISINSDITVHKEIQKQLASSQKMEAVGQLAGGMAHDFNNLLTVITGYSELLLRKMPEDNSFRRELEIIDQAGRSGCALTQQLLALSRQKPVQPRVFDISEPIREISKMLRGVMGSRITFDLKLPDSPHLICADPSQVQQIIVNLALNARDAMSKGGRFSIELKEKVVPSGANTSLESGRYIVCLFTDTGVGMSKEVLSRMFEPFYSTKKSRGMGLGLSMVRSTMRELRGDIRVESVPGEGTVLELFFPVTEEHSSPFELVTEEQYDQVQDTILVAEDEPAIRDLVCETLESYGYKIEAASDGKEALDMLRVHELRPSLILTDIVMPGLSGLDLVRQVLERDPTTKVLLMSGYFDDETIPLGRDGAPLPFLPKPFTPRSLVKKVREILEGGDSGILANPIDQRRSNQ